MLDACRSTRAKGMSGEEGFAISLGSPAGSSGLAWLFASADGEAAQDSDQLGGALFTHAWVTGLRGAADANPRRTNTRPRAPRGRAHGLPLRPVRAEPRPGGRPGPRDERWVGIAPAFEVRVPLGSPTLRFGWGPPFNTWGNDWSARTRNACSSLAAKPNGATRGPPWEHTGLRACARRCRWAPRGPRSVGAARSTKPNRTRTPRAGGAGAVP